MRDRNRIDVFMSHLTKLWKDRLPDLRFWQVIRLLENHTMNTYNIDDCWELEENEWLKIVNDLFYQYSLKEGETVASSEEYIKTHVNKSNFNGYWTEGVYGD